MNLFKKVITGILVTAGSILIGVFIIFYSYVNPSVSNLSDTKFESEKPTEVVAKNEAPVEVEVGSALSLKSKNFDQLLSIFRQINNPTPLNNLGAVGASDLDLNQSWSDQEIFNLTNQTRLESGLPLLSQNTTLTNIAKARLEDMFAKSYFAHTSPSGEGLEQVADKLGYSYITLGENLALGDFTSHPEIISAWLSSPAHRDNILARRYNNIGVAVRRGFLNGRSAVLAVQVFGAPLNKCFLPDVSVKNKILSNKNKLDALGTPLDQLNRVIDNPGATSLLARQRNILEYNRLAKEFNSLIDSTKQLISDYNKSVIKFNNCVKTEIN